MGNIEEMEELEAEAMADIRGGAYYFAWPVFLHIGMLVDLIS